MDAFINNFQGVDMEHIPSGKMTMRIAINMTTPGAIILSALAPAVFGLLLAVQTGVDRSPVLAVMLLLIPSLLNASGNVLNDYYDYIKGNDTGENVVSESDGPLAYNQVADPKPAYIFGLFLLAAAALLGIFVIYKTGWKTAAIGMAGVIVMLTYSGGILPTSYLPIGEPLSGFTMGGLIPLGVYTALTGNIDFTVLMKSIPMMLICTQFMLGNNTCDMIRDGAVGRKTLPILIGRKRAQHLANFLNLFWLIDLCTMIMIYFPRGWWALIPTLPVFLKGLLGTIKAERTHENKAASVEATFWTALAVAVGYPLAVGLHLLL